MNLPKYLFACLLCFVLSTHGRAQNSPSCKEIEVEVKVRETTSGKGGSIELSYSSGKPSDFKLFLFAPKRENNQLDIVSSEISGLKKGNYTLIIQGRENDTYCSKKIMITIN